MSLRALLTESLAPLTCRELLDRWPGTTPRADSLWRVLAHGVELGLFSVVNRQRDENGAPVSSFTLVSRTDTAEAILPTAADGDEINHRARSPLLGARLPQFATEKLTYVNIFQMMQAVLCYGLKKNRIMLTQPYI